MKITGAIRVIKGQEVLPDGSTLDEHGFIDGSNIVIEPEKEISIKMKHGPQEYTQEFTRKVMNSMRLRELKQQLIDGGTVGFSFKDFTLVLTSVDKDGATDNVLLQDESLPLHLCGVSDNMRITIIGSSIKVHLITHQGEHYFKHFPRNITVNQMKKRIHRNSHFFLNPVQVEDVWLFVEHDDYNYRKLDDEAPISAELSNNDIVHIVSDRFFQQRDMIAVYIENEFDEVGFERKHAMGKHQSETLFSLKTRSHGVIYLFATAIFLIFFLCDLRLSVHTVR